MPTDLHGEPAAQGRVQAAEAVEQPQEVSRAAEGGGAPALAAEQDGELSQVVRARHRPAGHLP